MIKIYYDGECPFCARYVQMLRLQKAGPVELVNLRHAPEKAEAFLAAGYPVNDGMVVEADGREYFGADAVSYLSAISTPSDFANRLNKAALSNPVSARLLYPILRAGRWFVLFLLGHTMIGEEGEGTHARQTLFAVLFGLYSIFHSFYYGVAYGTPSWDLLLLVATAILVVFNPARPALLFALMLAGAVSGIVQMPTPSNHAMLALFAMLAYLISLIIAMVRNDAASRVFERFAPAGCGLLLVMYFYGVFHKINADFLDPVTSCAMVLWNEMPAPLRTLQGPFIEYSAIYGTFIVEGLIAFCLLTRRFRHIGIAAGMGFHLLLSLSNYAMYLAFSMLTIALHSLFLTENSAKSILEAPIVKRVTGVFAEPLYWLLPTALFGLVATFALIGWYSEASLVAFLVVLPLCLAILFYGSQAGHYSRRGMGLAAIITAAYFANGAMPYLGLKTAQAGNMFANFRLEAGVSNHLVFSNGQRPFSYLDDVAIVEGESEGVVYYDLLDQLARNPQLSLTFERGGRVYRDQTAESLASDIEATLHPEWFRKWFHFQPVILERPEQCSRTS